MEEYFICSECGSDDVEVIRERGRELMLRCNECGNVWIITLPKMVKVPLIVSKHERSFKSEVELPEGEEIKVGDIVETEDDEVRITGIELEGDRRVNKAMIGKIKTLWGESLTYPKVIKVSIYLPKGVTQAFKVKVPRNEEFVVGEVLEVGGYTFRVEKIKTETKMLHHGKAKADRIVALMGHQIPRARARRSLEIYRGYSKESA
ncbi:HVO_0476 family zinc finger protein [Thermococcus thioreducens]|uniref:Intein N-terminal splicing region n=1 Tax=Thermococcus thioreducens TaxID=277988 RepID=A0A0Q2QQM9_9EURY|nr:HVO_0476 family zinc finger protein [Thermococcus thioreducens]ASJ12800.1 translation initiation factor 2 [Thermococcus thioreducens]KQH82269.1 translation initiation factor 2 [Thermococcus thioreducens]SEV85045.1 intein N-terminal splicing region [Thermococcus thioreducens]